MELTAHQRSALYKLVQGVKDKKLKQQTLGGYAGTGKTTLLKYLCQFFPNFGVCAYTGKAANVLRKKGVSAASTIHSRIYKAYFDNGIVYFDLVPHPGCDGFIVDEASMVSDDIYADLCSFDLPMIFVGDHGQLEPIDSKFNLMNDPDYKLEEIHRNAGSIAKFAEHLRKGYSARGFKSDSDQVAFIAKPSDDLLMSVDQVICAYNKTRVSINERIRQIQGYKEVINIGERVMCLRNNRNLGLFNGMQGTVVNLSEGKYRRKYMDFEVDGIVIRDIWYDPKQFGKETYNFDSFSKDSANPFDYASAITAHKSQGDEWPNVLAIEQKCNKWDHRRWAYTVASRAKEKLYWQYA